MEFLSLKIKHCPPIPPRVGRLWPTHPSALGLADTGPRYVAPCPQLEQMASPEDRLSGQRVSQNTRVLTDTALEGSCSQALPCPEAEGPSDTTGRGWNHHPRDSAYTCLFYFLKDCDSCLVTGVL